MAVNRAEPKRQISLVKTWSSSFMYNLHEFVGKNEALLSRASRGRITATLGVLVGESRVISSVQSWDGAYVVYFHRERGTTYDIQRRWSTVR